LVEEYLFIPISLVIDGRALRDRRQAPPNQVGSSVTNFVSNGFNTIRDTVAPAIGSTADRFSQYWDRYKQNINQGVSQIGPRWDQYKQQINQGWNQFTQSFNPQYPSYDNGNYRSNRKWQTPSCAAFVYFLSLEYGYNGQQYPYSMNNNYNMPSNMYPNYDGRQGNPYPSNNYYAPYNTGGQRYQNYGYQRQGARRR
jgi:hypothetical protein